MAVNYLADSATPQIDLVVKTEPPEPVNSSSNCIPLHISPNQDNITVPNETNVNSRVTNGQKRIQTSPMYAAYETSKKPRINTPEDFYNTDLDNMAVKDEVDLTKEASDVGADLTKEPGGDEAADAEEYYLIVRNLPGDWTYVQIKNYLDIQCGHVDELEMLKHRKSNSYAIRLTFQSIEKCKDVYKKLENEFVQDKKLNVKIYGTYTTSGTVPSTIQDSNKTTNSHEVIAATRWRPDLDSMDVDPEGLYGLRLEFLKALKIEPPLNKTVLVKNFKCDKADLKEMMEMAGKVLMCSVVPSYKKYAKVMYSHPLEAVQSISMLNGQFFYGSALQITMERNQTQSIVLPKGLAGIGQGLGIKARPIHNIVEQYHRFAKKQRSSINTTIFSEIDFSDGCKKIKTEEESEEIKKNIQEFLRSRPGCNIVNPTVQSKAQKMDDMACPDPLNGSNLMPEPSFVCQSRSGGENKREASSQDLAKKGVDMQHNNSAQLALPNNVVRLGNPNGQGNLHPNLRLNLPVPSHMSGQMPFFPSDSQEPHPFRPRVPFIPPSMHAHTYPPPSQPSELLPPMEPHTLPTPMQHPTLPPSEQPPMQPHTYPPPSQPSELLPPMEPHTLPTPMQHPTLPPSEQPPMQPHTYPPPSQPSELLPPMQPHTFPTPTQRPTLPPSKQPPMQPHTFPTPTQRPTLPPSKQPHIFPNPTQPPKFPPSKQPPMQAHTFPTSVKRPTLPRPMKRPTLPPPMKPPTLPPPKLPPPMQPLTVLPRKTQFPPSANLGNSVTVKFSNLPSSMTYSMFCDLLAQCGKVTSAQLTTPGCAVATFSLPSHAEMCFQKLDGLNVKGHIIEASFA